MDIPDISMTAREFHSLRKSNSGSFDQTRCRHLSHTGQWILIDKDGDPSCAVIHIRDEKAAAKRDFTNMAAAASSQGERKQPKGFCDCDDPDAFKLHEILYCGRCGLRVNRPTKGKGDIKQLKKAGKRPDPARAQRGKLLMTVGRNDICPCGSGKKSKHCCNHKVWEGINPKAPK